MSKESYSYFIKVAAHEDRVDGTVWDYTRLKLSVLALRPQMRLPYQPSMRRVMINAYTVLMERQMAERTKRVKDNSTVVCSMRIHRKSGLKWK